MGGRPDKKVPLEHDWSVTTADPQPWERPYQLSL